MTNLTRASHELFRRTPDETFPSLDVFHKHFQWQKEQSLEVWQPPRTLSARPVPDERLMLDAGDDGAYTMNDWSFGQLCRLSGIAKETVNRLTPDNVYEALSEIRRAIEALVRKRDERRDGFLKAVKTAMETKLGDDAEEVQKILSQNGVARSLAKEAIAIAQERGRYTIFGMVDALAADDRHNRR